jgi:hypothetical protein
LQKNYFPLIFLMKKYLTFFFFASIIVCFSCKKTIEKIERSAAENYFNNNLIGRNFIVTLATDSTNDLTSDYAGYTFVLLKTDYYHGPLKATKGTNKYEGTWSCNEDYSKLTISLPDSIPEFKFLNRNWRFTKKDVPTLKLASWGSTAPVVLYMTRQ